MSLVNFKEIALRRELFFQETRKAIRKYVNPDGSGTIPQFNPPWREIFWIAPALYTGDKEDVMLANRMIGRFFSCGKAFSTEIGKESDGRLFNVFLSNTAAGLYAEYDDKLTPEARDVLRWHTEQVFRTYAGAAQPDLKFHGCNDNMPMMSTKGLILGGQKMKHERAVRQGIWNLNEFRRLLSRSAWASEFNSSTYSAITLSNVAKIAERAEEKSVRTLARECEERLWAELLLHFHPDTRRSAGPSCRCYSADWVGHAHATQALLWLVLGAEISGYDIPDLFFHSEKHPRHVIHYLGNTMQNIAEFSDFFDTEYHLPESLAELAVKKRYPALLRGRSESMSRYNGCAGVYHTETYMEESFSLGTVDTPLCSGDQTAQLYATYKRKPVVADFRDSAAVFYRYFKENVFLSRLEHSYDDGFQGEPFTRSHAWAYTMQKNNVALLLTIPNLQEAPLLTDVLRLDVVFPAHYGGIRRSVIGDGKVLDGAQGDSTEVVPVSVETGEVYIHVYPLIPTSLPRRHALRFEKEDRYERLALFNYEGRKFPFRRELLECVQNGFVFTIDDRSKWSSLEEFHRAHSDCLILDYTLAGRRFFRFKRFDVQFELCYTPAEFGVQTRAIDGRNAPEPVFESNQLDVSALPFMSGSVEPDVPFFPWGKSLEMHNYPQGSWQIGSRGLTDEVPYSRRNADLKLIP